AQSIRHRLRNIAHITAIACRSAEWAGDPRARDIQPRTYDSAALEGLALRDAPGRVIMNVRDGRYPVWEEHWHLPVLEVHVSIDEARENCATVQLDNAGVRWICDLSCLAHRLDAGSFDDDDGVCERSATGAVNQRSTFKYENVLLSGRLRRSKEQAGDHNAN